MSKSQLLYTGRITAVRFNLSGTKSAINDSYAQIKSYDLFRNNQPFAEGVYDAHLGTTDHAYKCQTCHNSKQYCLGHEGHINLNYPVWNPIGVNEGRKWLKLVCFSCGQPVIDPTQYMRFSRLKRLDEASKIARTAVRKCVNCGELHPTIKKDTTEPLLLIAKLVEDGRQTAEWKIYPHTAAVILDRISDETVVNLGKKINSHPRNCVLTSIKVPSVTIRPDVKKMGGGRSTNDDLTTMLQIIVKKSASMPNIVPDIIEPKLEKAIFEINNSYYEFVRANGEGAMSSLALRFKGKTGRFRKNQLGKRVRKICRSTIVGDRYLQINEVGIPLVFAKTIQYDEVVQEYNKQRLLGYVQNGQKKYPGASKIVKKNSGATYNIDIEGLELEIGDIVFRDMIDGDPVLFNRQPSLTISNIGCHKAKVINNDGYKVILMNVIACSLYNADFDGDQMNVICCTGLAAKNEISELAAISNWFISHTTSSPSMGQADDSIIGMAELTRTGVTFNKYHAMLLFQDTLALPTFNDVGPAGITGRECISKILQDTPINFTRECSWYNPDMAGHIKYDPTEIKVHIDRGKLLTGILDKKSIGKGANGGIYHIIANEYGSKKAIEVMFDMQQMAICHILQAGYTIGIMDLIISATSKAEIDAIGSDIINKSHLITEELNNGEIIPPIGKTVEEFFEHRQINTLYITEDFADPILRAIDHNTNNLFKLVMFGSKGKIDNVYNMISSIGQKLINGERIRQKFGFKRTLPYFPRFDNSPVSRGYITNSYLTGMTSPEYIFNAMAARFDLITKALSTAVTGEQGRKSIKNLETLIATNFRSSAKGQNIVQFIYGEDGLDPRKVERVKFPTVFLSDADFESQYKHPSYPDEFELMQADRAKYRTIFTKIEGMNVKELMSDYRRIPINVDRIISDTLREFADMKATGKDISTNTTGTTSAANTTGKDISASATGKDISASTGNNQAGTTGTSNNQADALELLIEAVNNLTTCIPYVLINEIQEKRKMKVPLHIASACWLVCMIIRSYLHPNALLARGITMPMLTQIINKIRVIYARALIEPGTTVGIIAAQSFSEPLTQYMLDAHHRSASGGTSKTGMTKTKEIMGAKDVHKLKSPSMLIPVHASIAENKAQVQEIANNIEMMNFRQFVVLWQVFFEKYGEPIHTDYKHEKMFIDEFAKLNPLLRPPGDLTKWCVRLQINRTTLILKNMALELIITRLREAYPETYIICSPENSADIVIRIYLRSAMFKSTVTLHEVTSLVVMFLDTIIRGVDGIINTTVVKMLRHKITDNGSIVRNDNLWGISTNGTNMHGILAIKFIDKYNVQTDAIQEVYRMFGIEAARQKIMSELRELVDVCNHRHYMVYADEMSFTGRVTSIESSGLRARESANILLITGFSNPLNTLENAAVNSLTDHMVGVSSPLMVGSIPLIGTLYNKFHIDIDFVRKHVKRPDDILDTLFD